MEEGSSQKPLNPIEARLQAQRSHQTRPSSASSSLQTPITTPRSNVTTLRGTIPVQNRGGPVPQRDPLPITVTAPVIRGPPQPAAGAMFPAPNSSQRAGARNKVVLQPGCSPLDWARLNTSGENLRGIDPRDFPMRVTKEMLKQHKSQEDCWTVLRGKVYNITPYVRFHPGGVEEVMKCAGKDGTLLFMKYHAWVNYERMLENCLVGFYMG